MATEVIDGEVDEPAESITRKHKAMASWYGMRGKVATRRGRNTMLPESESNWSRWLPDPTEKSIPHDEFGATR